jgi:hypothetical protein
MPEDLKNELFKWALECEYRIVQVYNLLWVLSQDSQMMEKESVSEIPVYWKHVTLLTPRGNFIEFNQLKKNSRLFFPTVLI